MVLMQMLICILRSVHSGYLPKHEPFGRNIETMLIWFFVVMGDYEGKPFVISKLAAYMRMPRTTVMRKIKQLQEWKMIERRGRHYYAHEKTLNSTSGLRSYRQGRRAVANAVEKLSISDTYRD
jgi:hypothetical protein